ncbi:MAG TPA: hypothetical protein QF901_15980 [Gammaproteobacteria bacterium]|nr:hypothetical protein [Gammaproteobacteria bacterium]
MGIMSGAAVKAVEDAAVTFPSVEWFARLAQLMNENRARQEQLGYVDCVAEFVVTDAESTTGRWAVQVVFEEFEVLEVVETTADNADRVDFSLEASVDTWGEMIDNIAAHGGRPDLEHSLNYLSHLGAPIKLVADDPLCSDLYFRYNQSLQEFVNASVAFTTTYCRAG